MGIGQPSHTTARNPVASRVGWGDCVPVRRVVRWRVVRAEAGTGTGQWGGERVWWGGREPDRPLGRFGHATLAARARAARARATRARVGLGSSELGSCDLGSSGLGPGSLGAPHSEASTAKHREGRTREAGGAMACAQAERGARGVRGSGEARPAGLYVPGAARGVVGGAARAATREGRVEGARATACTQRLGEGGGGEKRACEKKKDAVRKRPKFGPAILRSVRSSTFVSLARKMICGHGGGRRACGEGGERGSRRASLASARKTPSSDAGPARARPRHRATPGQPRRERKSAEVGTSALASHSNENWRPNINNNETPLALFAPPLARMSKTIANASREPHVGIF